jgi:hypothetical protein
VCIIRFTTRFDSILNTCRRISKTAERDIVIVKQRQYAKDNQVILNWITLTDYGPQQSDFLRRRQSGTGQWLLDSEKYQTWLNGNQETLFCPGIPGSGKTILTSIVIDDLFSKFQSEATVGIAYIYFNFRRKDEQTIEDLLASILKQLAQSQSAPPESVQELYDQHRIKRTRPSLGELLKVLRLVVTTYSQVFIIVDALDECQISGGCRSRFLSEMFNLQTAIKANIFATSRPILDIKHEFRGCMSQEILAHDEDVRKYLEGHMSELPTFVPKRPDLQQQIKDGISNAAEGM